MQDDQADQGPSSPALSRRRFLGTAGAVAGASAAVGGVALKGGVALLGASPDLSAASESFYGHHQGGITTPRQSHTQFATLDVVSGGRSDLIALLQRWTALAADLAEGRSVGSSSGAVTAPADSGEALGLGPARLTVNFGFGPSLFGVGTEDRFGLRDRYPVPLVELPDFPGDEIDPADDGGDLTVQVCADDAQVAFHALRQIVRSAQPVAVTRWTQAGFISTAANGGTPRNILGFKDGSVNPTSRQQETSVWVGEEGPGWMTGGTFLVMRRIRVNLEGWDATPLEEQQAVIGRSKASGAPLGRSHESDPLDLSARAEDGTLAIPAAAHVRLASPQDNWGAMMLRRSYSYDGGRIGQGSSSRLDAGLLFACYQRYPVVSFVQTYRKLATSDALSKFTTHTASATAALPPAATHSGDWVGRQLFE